VLVLRLRLVHGLARDSTDQGGRKAIGGRLLNFDLNQSAALAGFLQYRSCGTVPKAGYRMRAPAERDQCQAKLDLLIEGFMRADWAAYRDAAAWLRDFADQKNDDTGRVICGGRWFTPQTIEAVRERARMRQLDKGRATPTR